MCTQICVHWRVDSSGVVMGNFQMSLDLNATEARVLKAALLVEIAALENRIKSDGQPDLWLPSLSAARRVFTVLCDRANRHLLDL